MNTFTLHRASKRYCLPLMGLSRWLFLFGFIALLGQADLLAQTNYYSKSTGNLNVLSTWGLNTDGTGTAPANFSTANNFFNIRNRATATIGANWTVSGTGSKVIVGDGTNACEFDMSTGSYVTSSGNATMEVSNNAAFRIAGFYPEFGTILMQDGSRWIHNGSTTAVRGNTTSSITWQAGSTIEFIGANSSLPGNLSNNIFHHVIWNKNQSSNNVILEQSITANGNFRVQNTGTGFLGLGNSTTSRILTIGGDLVIEGGNFNINGATGSSGTREVVVAGDVVMTSGRFQPSRSSTTSYTLGVLRVSGDVLFTGGTLGLSSNTQYGTIQVEGGGVHVLRMGATVDAVFNAQFVVKDGNTLEFFDASTILDIPNASSSAARFEVESGAGLIIKHPEGISASNTLGCVRFTSNAVNASNIVLSTGGNYTFQGTSPQVPGTKFPASVNNLGINNGAGVTLGAACTANGTLTLTNGILSTTGVNLLSIASSGSISGGSATSYVDGPLQRTLPGSGPYAWPVGGSSYLPFTLADVSGSSPVVTVQAFNSATGGIPNAPLVALSDDERWEVSVDGGTYTDGSVSIARQSALGSFNAIGRSATEGGTYTSLGGTVSGNAVEDSEATGNTLGVFRLAELVESEDCVAPNLNAKFDGEDAASICAGEEGTLSAAVSSGANCAGGFEYAWYTGDGTGNTYWNGSTWDNAETWGAYATITGVEPSETTTYKVKVRCIGEETCNNEDAVGVEVTVSDPPTTSNAGSDIEQCNDGAFTLDGNTPDIGTGAWSVFAGTASITTPGSPSSAVTGVPAGTTATLRWTITSGGCAASTSDVVLRNVAAPSVDAQFNGSNGPTVCAGTSGTLTANPSGGGACTGTFEYAWYTGDGNDETYWDGNDWDNAETWGAFASISDVEPAATTTYKVKVRCSTFTTCGNEDATGVTVTVNQAPTTALAGDDQTQCGNSAFSLAANAPSVGTGAWSVISGPGAVTTPTSPTSGVTGVTEGSSLTLRWTISNAPCTASFDDVLLTNGSAPGGVVADASEVLVCQGSEIDLSSSVASMGPVTILQEDFNGVSNNWTVSNTNGIGTPPVGAWTLRPNGFNPGGGAVNSNDASQFMNADRQSTNLDVVLVSPVFSLLDYSAASLDFFHYFNNTDLNGRGRVQVSSDGINWTNLIVYASETVASRTSFQNPSFSLNAYVGQPSVQVRFQYVHTFGNYDGWSVDNVSIIGTPSPVYSWSSDPSGFTSSQQNPLGVVVNANTTYTVTVEHPSGCTSSAEVSVALDLTDTDGDGIIDCVDNCPTVVGVQGDFCDADPDPNTFALGVLDSNCACTLLPPDLDVTMELRTPDGSSDNITWELVTNVGSQVVCSGGGYPSGITDPITAFCSIPNGCYRLRVQDESGDGVGFGPGGGYQLRLAGPNAQDIRIVDNLGNFSSGVLSAIGNGPAAICFPMASDPKPLYQHRDKLDFVSGQYLISEEDAAVSAVWNPAPNAVQSTNTGYEFWLFDPNGSYSYRRFRNHATSDGFGNVGATRACHMKVNGWFASQAAPANVLLNVRIRTRVNGVNGDWGPAYRFKIDPARAACPLTLLNDFPGNAFESCGQTRTWGGSTLIHARPVSGANRYQWRFRTVGEPLAPIIIRTSNTYFLTLNWTVNPLQPGKTYEVDVRASKTAGATWCTDAVLPALVDPWGTVCLLTIQGSNAQGGGQNLALENSNTNLSLYPNPNRGDQVMLSIDAVDEGVETISVDFFDLAGHRAVARTIPTQGNNLNSLLELNGLAAGVYIVHITAGDKVYTERLVVTQ
jgi:hypothetical protein